MQLEARLRERLAIADLPSGGPFEQPGARIDEHRDAGPPAFDEVLDGKGRALLDLGGHDGDARGVDLVVEHDDRQPVGGEANEVGMAVAGREHDHAVDAVAEQ